MSAENFSNPHCEMRLKNPLERQSIKQGKVPETTWDQFFSKLHYEMLLKSDHTNAKTVKLIKTSDLFFRRLY
jgi:hypothetical protein